jgi:hypothetical protein
MSILSDAGDFIEDAGRSLGRFVTGAKFGSSDTKIHVANTTNEDIYCIPMPNTDWAIADTAFGTLTSIAFAYLSAGLGSAFTASAIANAASKMAMLATCVSIYRNSTGIIGAIGDQAEAEKMRNCMRELEDMVMRDGICIPPDDYKQVNDLSLIRPLDYIFGANGWGQLFGASTYSLVIINKSFTRSTWFNTDSDYSWIVKENEIVRAKHGRIAVEDRSEGFARFPKYKVMLPEYYLSPGECLVSPNSSYDLVFQEDRNVVLYERFWPNREKARWSTGTKDSNAEKFILQNDGNLVLYGADGKVLVALDDYGSGPEYKNRRLFITKNGRILLQSSGGKDVWDSGESPEKFKKK